MAVVPWTVFGATEMEDVAPGFDELRSSPAAEPARRIAEELYAEFPDPEGHFLEQLQRENFEQRLFELFLFGYFSRSGFEVARHSQPSFAVSRSDTTVAIESVRVEPSPTRTGRKKPLSDLSEQELRDYEDRELPAWFGPALERKLSERFWDHESARGLPVVLAVEAVHREQPLLLSDYALARYVYGLEGKSAKSRAGFFAQPESEQISAILFTNSSTEAKLARIGYQTGIGCDEIRMVRTGHALNTNREAGDPTFFSYDLDSPPLVEFWGQGLVVLHNPAARHPVPKGFFVHAAEGHMTDGEYHLSTTGWHPIASTTRAVHIGDVKRKLNEVWGESPRIAISAISQERFLALCGVVISDFNPLVDESAWFADDTLSFCGVLLREKPEGAWGHMVLARDQMFHFYVMDSESGFGRRGEARDALQAKIAELLSQPQRIFPR
jgi:hypothetical protein